MKKEIETLKRRVCCLEGEVLSSRESNLEEKKKFLKKKGCEWGYYSNLFTGGHSGFWIDKNSTNLFEEKVGDGKGYRILYIERRGIEQVYEMFKNIDKKPKEPKKNNNKK